MLKLHPLQIALLLFVPIGCDQQPKTTQSLAFDIVDTNKEERFGCPISWDDFVSDGRNNCNVVSYGRVEACTEAKIAAAYQAWADETFTFEEIKGVPIEILFEYENTRLVPVGLIFPELADENLFLRYDNMMITLTNEYGVIDIFERVQDASQTSMFTKIGIVSAASKLDKFATIPPPDLTFTTLHISDPQANRPNGTKSPICNQDQAASRWRINTHLTRRNEVLKKFFFSLGHELEDRCIPSTNPK